jgi:hypothetical protein
MTLSTRLTKLQDTNVELQSRLSILQEAGLQTSMKLESVQHENDRMKRESFELIQIRKWLCNGCP